MTRYVSQKPSDFYRYLIEPGLPIPSAGSVPLAQYVCAVEAYGGSKNAEGVIGAVNRGIPLDSSRGTLANGSLPPDNKISHLTRSIGRMTTGQGYPSDFILVMEHIAQNLDDVKRLVVQPWRSEVGPRGARVSVPDGAPRPISEIFGYKGPMAVHYLNAMVEKKVFGLDCIGFVSQYLVYSGVWQAYKTYYPQNYTQEFRPIRSLSQIRALAVLIWSNVHIAIIDTVKSFDPDPEHPRTVTVDICQSSAGGPQLNRDVVIELAPGDTYNGNQLFRFRNRDRLPVNSPVYIGVMPDLYWQADQDVLSGALIEL